MHFMQVYHHWRSCGGVGGAEPSDAAQPGRGQEGRKRRGRGAIGAAQACAERAVGERAEDREVDNWHELLQLRRVEQAGERLPARAAARRVGHRQLRQDQRALRFVREQ